MRMSGRGFHQAVAEKLSDRRQTLPERQCPRGEGMPKVVNPNAPDSRTFAENLPGRPQVAHGLAADPPRNYVLTPIGRYSSSPRKRPRFRLLYITIVLHGFLPSGTWHC